VATVHLSVRHALRLVTPRGVALRAAGGAAERWLLPGADAVIALTPSTGRPRSSSITGMVPLAPHVAAAEAAMAKVPDGATVQPALDLLAPLAARTGTS
jgi:hypothetical protein